MSIRDLEPHEREMVERTRVLLRHLEREASNRTLRGRPLQNLSDGRRGFCIMYHLDQAWRSGFDEGYETGQRFDRPKPKELKRCPLCGSYNDPEVVPCPCLQTWIESEEKRRGES